MKWRAPQICLEIFCATVVAILVLGAVAFWRLSQGPVSISFLTPYVTRTLADIPSVDIEVQDTILTWSGWKSPLDVRAVGVTATMTDGRLIAAVPEISMRFSIAALVRGELELTRLVIHEPAVRLVRTEAGELKVGIGLETGESSDRFSAVTAALLAPARPGAPMGYLKRVSLVDGSLSVDDRRLGISWGAPKAFFRMERGDDGIEVQFDLRTDLGDQTPRVRGSGTYIGARKQLDIDADIVGLWPSRLATKAPAFKHLAYLDFPVGGNVRFGLGADWAINTALVKLSGGSGRIDIPGVLQGPVEVRGTTVHGTLKHSPRRVILDSLDIDLGGPRLNATAVMTTVEKVSAVKGELVVRNLPVAGLRKYWPRGASPNALRWISANITKGVIREARSNLLATADIEQGQVVVNSITGSLRTRGLTIHYLRPLPPFVNVKARGRFGSDSLTFDLQSGDANGVAVQSGKVAISGLAAGKERLAVDVVLDGPLRNALEILDHPRFGYATAMGIVPERVGGTAVTRLGVRLPLIAKLPFSKVSIRADSELRAVAVPDIVLGVGVTDGTFAMQLDNSMMTLTGQGRFAGVPSDMIVRRRFRDATDFITQATVKGTVQDAHMRDLKIDLAPYVGGPIDADVRYTERPDKSREIVGKLGLAGARLAFPLLDWSKPAEADGTASFTMRVDSGQGARVEDFRIGAGALDIAGTAEIANAEGLALRRIDVSRFKLGETDLRATMTSGADGDIRLAIAGPVLDGRPLMAIPSGSAENGAAERSWPFTMTTEIEKVVVSAGQSVAKLFGGGRYDGTRWRTLDFAARMTPGQTVSLGVKSDARTQTVVLKSNDAGALLKRLGIADGLSAGFFEATASQGVSNARGPWSGRVLMKDFRIVRAPTLARLLTLASLRGIQSVLSGGDGIHFSRLEVPYTLENGTALIKNARAVGSQMGLTADGRVGLGANTINLRGTIVPAYTINSLLGHIPLIGKIFTNTKGSGVFAVSYAVDGKLDDPKPSANPLSVLTPGFLRNLADVIVSGEPDNSSPLDQTQDN